jgi:hypothetical protein
MERRFPCGFLGISCGNPHCKRGFCVVEHDHEKKTVKKRPSDQGSEWQVQRQDQKIPKEAEAIAWEIVRAKCRRENKRFLRDKNLGLVAIIMSNPAVINEARRRLGLKL